MARRNETGRFEGGAVFSGVCCRRSPKNATFVSALPHWVFPLAPPHPLLPRSRPRATNVELLGPWLEDRGDGRRRGDLENVRHHPAPPPLCSAASTLTRLRTNTLRPRSASHPHFPQVRDPRWFLRGSLPLVLHPAARAPLAVDQPWLLRARRVRGPLSRAVPRRRAPDGRRPRAGAQSRRRRGHGVLARGCGRGAAAGRRPRDARVRAPKDAVGGAGFSRRDCAEGGDDCVE